MALDGVQKRYLNFVGGLSTEASPLSFPDNTAKDLDNVDLQRNGSIKRRLALDYEDDHVLSEASFDSGQLAEFAIVTYEWRSVAGNGDLNFLVVQIGPKLYFHDLDVDSLSDNAIGALDFSPTQTDGAFAFNPVDMVQGRGALFVVGRFIEPFYVRYNQALDQFDGFPLTLRIRDMDGLPIREDPTAVITTGEETPAEPEDTDFNFEFDWENFRPFGI